MTNSDEKQTGYGLLVALCASVVAVYIIYWSWITFSVHPNDRGTFGDMFGGLNALFSALAFSGLIFTAILQRQELALQRAELRETRDVFRLQSFESTFFQLLRLHHEIVAAITLPSQANNNSLVGRRAFSGFRKLVTRKYLRLAPNVLHAEEDLRAVRSGYQSAYRSCQAYFGHYFRNLYHIVKFVHESDVDNKYRYTALVRAQLSTDELVCLYYNCLSPEGDAKFKPLAETYSLFNNLPDAEFIREFHRDYMNRLAFGREAT